MDQTAADTDLTAEGEKGTTSTAAPKKTNAQKKRDRAAAKQEKIKAKKASNPKRDEQWSTDIDRENTLFEQYYKAQNLLQEEEDWDAFMKIMRIDLPTTFRVTGNKAAANDVNRIIREIHVPALTGIEYEGAQILPPSPIPWYPGGLGWQLNVHKNVVRKVPEFKKLQSFLVYETEVGNISRQEAVSMIPPLLLDVESHHSVMDMCAAPGSKTAQLLEALHTSESGEYTVPRGVIVANDSDYKRAGLLVHQSSRLPSPALIVTNVDASYYPNIRLDGSGKLLEFDRILCDVPCSGDGTLRKNPIIWRQWGAASGNGLHSLQLRILQRAMKMLEKNGRIVYSTCSLNPVENEAVVAAALKSSDGEYHLVDVSERLSTLIRRPGVSQWKVPLDKALKRMATSLKDLEELDESQRREVKVAETMFPPTENVESLHLERCWRIYPHLQNTGGFFIAVLERSPSLISPPPRTKPAKRTAAEAAGTPDPANGEPETALGPALKRPRLDRPDTEMEVDPENVEVDESTEISSAPVPAMASEEKKTTGTYREDPFTYVDPAYPGVQRCLEGLKLRGSSEEGSMPFPSQNLFVRNADPTVLRSIYISNDLGRAVLTSNEPRRLRIISAGIKVATKQEGSHRAVAKLAQQDGAPLDDEQKGLEDLSLQKYRVLNDAVTLVTSYMKEGDIIRGSLGVLETFVRRVYPLAKEFEEPYRQIFESCDFGHHILRIEPSSEHASSSILTHPLTFAIWKSNVSLSLMLDKRSKSALSLRLFGEDLTQNGSKTAAVASQATTANVEIEGSGRY